MNELEDILNYLETTSLEPHDDYTSEFTYKNQKLLWNYIKKLKGQLEQKENEIKELCKKIKVNERSRRKMQKSLMETVQKSEKARKEAIELINNINDWEFCSKYDCIYKDDILDVLRILDIDERK